MTTAAQSRLLLKLATLIKATVPELREHTGSWIFARTRSKSKESAKWIMTFVTNKGRKISVMSLVPARDLTRTEHKLVVLQTGDDGVWIGYRPNVDGLLAQLQASPLWTKTVARAVNQALKQLSSDEQPTKE